MSEPSKRGSAPGRVNLIGEWIDFNGGLVMPMTLTRQVHVSLYPGDPEYDQISSDRFSGIASVPIDAPAEGHWPDYVRGALAHARDGGWIEGGQKVHVSGELPAGAGVSSSAAIIIAVLRAAGSGQPQLPPPELAKTARKIENDFIGVPCGIMDQMAIAAGRPGKVMGLDTRTLAYQMVDVPRDWAFLVFDSGLRRSLADGRYRERREECLAAATRLGYDWLVDAPEQAIRNLPEILRRRARHVTSENKRSKAAMNALGRADRADFGRLMDESHVSMRDDMEASHPAIDEMVIAARHAGADGARITGAGFGGCFVCLVPADQQTAIANQLQDLFPALQRIS